MGVPQTHDGVCLDGGLRQTQQKWSITQTDHLLAIRSLRRTALAHLSHLQLADDSRLPLIDHPRQDRP